MKFTVIPLAIIAIAAAVFAAPEPPDLRPALASMIQNAQFIAVPIDDPLPAGGVNPPAPYILPVPVPAAPAYANPDAFQAAAFKWIGVATAVVASLAAFAAFVVTKIGELKRTLQSQREEFGGRLDRQQAVNVGVSKQLATLAIATPGGGLSDTQRAKLTMEPAALVQPEDKTAKTGLAGLAIACLACLSLMGCSTTGPDAAKNAQHAKLNAAGTQALKEAAGVIGQVAVSAILNAAQQEIGGGKADFGSAAAAGLWANVNANDALARAGRIVQAYSGGQAPNTAKAVENAVSGVAGEERAPEVMHALATVISTAAGAPPKS